MFDKEYLMISSSFNHLQNGKCFQITPILPKCLYPLFLLCFVVFNSIVVLRFFYFFESFLFTQYYNEFCGWARNSPFSIFGLRVGLCELQMCCLCVGLFLSSKLSYVALCLYSTLGAPGSLRPLRTVRASFPAYGSSPFKAIPAKGYPAMIYCFLHNKCSYLLALFS